MDSQSFLFMGFPPSVLAGIKTLQLTKRCTRRATSPGPRSRQEWCPENAMATRAKFRVTALTEHEGDSKTLKLECRYDNSIPEDQRFLKATPWGSNEMRLRFPFNAYHVQLEGKPATWQKHQTDLYALLPWSRFGGSGA
jgi:hypothetical protein